MLLQNLRALSKAPGGAGSIWKYFEALARATGVSGRFVYGFRTELHFADVETVNCENAFFKNSWRNRINAFSRQQQ